MSGATIEVTNPKTGQSETVTLKRLEPCQDIYADIKYGELISRFEACFQVAKRALDRVELWETWEDNERAAQEAVKDG